MQRSPPGGLAEGRPDRHLAVAAGQGEAVAPGVGLVLGDGDTADEVPGDGLMVGVALVPGDVADDGEVAAGEGRRVC